MTSSSDIILNSMNSIKSMFKSLGDEIPSLNEVIAIIRSKESRRGVVPKPQSVESSAMVTNKNNDHLPVYGKATTTRNLSQGSKDESWCPKCRITRHTLDRCWKIQGKPSYKDKGNKGKQQTWSQTHIIVQDRASGKTIGCVKGTDFTAATYQTICPNNLIHQTICPND